MESAIPERLRPACPHSERAPRTPPYASYVSRFDPHVERVVMAYFGLQYLGASPSAASAALAWLVQQFPFAHGPVHWDQAQYRDEADYTNLVTVAYWDDRKIFEDWFAAVRDGWTGHHAFGPGIGTFVEVLCPAIEDFETLFSSLGRPEGVAAVTDKMSGEILEHAYWGGVRDRIPRALSHDLASTGGPDFIRDGARVRVVAHDNLCLIRSGQDWADSDAAERKMYLDDVEPILRRGMDFLRDDGLSIGCFANRYMVVTQPSGEPTEKSYGMSWWHGLADLEAWAESHPTHVAIFGAAMKHLSALGANARLRLYHEVTVVRSGDHFFEYLNCHQRTGMLRAAPV